MDQVTQHEDFKQTSHARFCLRVLEESLQQDPCLREETATWLFARPGNAYAYQRQVLLFARVLQVGSLRQIVCLCPAESSRQVALGQFHLRPHCGPLSQEDGSEAVLVSHLSEHIERCERLDALSTRLLEAS